MPTIQIIVKGKVQGVFYRATAKQVAEELGLKGTIRNTSDGNVEILATGSRTALDKFAAWCKEGPRVAEVEETAVVNHEEHSFPDFRIIH